MVGRLSSSPSAFGCLAGSPSSHLVKMLPRPWWRSGPSEGLRSVPPASTMLVFWDAGLPLSGRPAPLSLAISVLLSFFSILLGRCVLLDAGVASGHLFLFVSPSTGFPQCVRLLRSQLLCPGRRSLDPAEACRVREPRWRFLRSLGSAVGTLASRCLLGSKLYFH